MDRIKVIDLSMISLEKECTSLADRQSLGQLINQSFQEIGFMYVKNHGLKEEVIQQAFKSSMDFFNLEDSEKSKVSKGVEYQGWVCEGREIFDQDEDGVIADHEVRETYDLKNISTKGIFPDQVCPGLRGGLTQLGLDSSKLAQRLLQCISLGMNEKEDMLSSLHLGILEQDRNGIDNASTIRSIHYPPIRSEDVRPGIIRCGEHSDYGTITLLFQDSMGGLEVKNVEGKWVSADPIPGCILINVGDLLENLTAGQYPATRHRVKIPQEELRRRSLRQSIAFFVHPDDHVLCSPLGGPDPRYPPVTARQHLENRFADTYGDRLTDRKSVV